MRVDERTFVGRRTAPPGLSIVNSQTFGSKTPRTYASRRPCRAITGEYTKSPDVVRRFRSAFPETGSAHRPRPAVDPNANTMVFESAIHAGLIARRLSNVRRIGSPLVVRLSDSAIA